MIAPAAAGPAGHRPDLALTQGRFPVGPDHRPTVRYMSALLRAARDTAIVVPNADILGRALEAGEDRVLYAAYRDIQPPRRALPLPGPSGPAGGGEFVYADLVLYSGGSLPGGEPVRSLGHWNTPAQLEIFQVISGQVLMMTAWHDARGPHLCHQIAGPGELMSVPLGAAHVTYVLSEEGAAVFNIYTDLPGLPDVSGRGGGPEGSGHSSRQAALSPELKYRAEHPVPALTGIRTPNPQPVGPAAQPRGWGEPVAAGPPFWLTEHFAARDLADWHLHATCADIALLRQAAVHAGPEAWFSRHRSPVEPVPATLDPDPDTLLGSAPPPKESHS